MFIPPAYQNEKHWRQYLAQWSVSSKYKVEPESKKSNTNDIFPQKRWGSKPGGNYDYLTAYCLFYGDRKITAPYRR